jgi:hypothetical protein
MSAKSLFDQDMLILETVLVTIGAGGSDEYAVATACMNWGLRLPSEFSRFSVIFPKLPEQIVQIAELRKDLLISRTHGSHALLRGDPLVSRNYAITQSLVWMSEHNATDSMVGSHSVYPLDRYPSTEEIQAARILFNGLE